MNFIFYLVWSRMEDSKYHLFRRKNIYVEIRDYVKEYKILIFIYEFLYIFLYTNLLTSNRVKWEFEIFLVSKNIYIRRVWYSKFERILI